MGADHNIVGKPLPKEVIDQITARAQLQGQIGYQGDRELTFKSKKNAFAKLTSFISVDDEGLAKELGVGTGTEAAQEWCLYNGVHTGNGRKFDIKYEGGGLKGYEGTNELGIRPMPGITSMTIKPAGMGGSIRLATINVKCHNLNQLNAIDALYLRLGFSMLIE
jgi:hypothetical protein